MRLARIPHIVPVLVVFGNGIGDKSWSNGRSRERPLLWHAYAGCSSALRGKGGKAMAIPAAPSPTRAEPMNSQE